MALTTLLLDSQTTDVTGTSALVPFRISTVMLTGVFAGATVDIEASGDEGATWLAIGVDATFTDQGSIIVELPTCFRVRAVQSGSTGTTDITARITGNY